MIWKHNLFDLNPFKLNEACPIVQNMVHLEHTLQQRLTDGRDPLEKMFTMNHLGDCKLKPQQNTTTY